VKVPDAKAASVESFLKLAAYHELTFHEFGDYVALQEVLTNIDDQWGVCSNKLFYLSVPPQFYDAILTNLHASHLTDPCAPEEGWARVIVEKPFGSDEATAKALDARLAKLFREAQIYRVDHYLGKEMLRNILTFRFDNNLFEGEWSRHFVESIHIRLFESLGVEDRGGFYDGVGALRDVGQNHLLQILALVAMERPAGAGAETIRAARADILRKLEVPSLRDAAKRSFRAQYEGYRGIKGVAATSETETYFRLTGYLAGDRWNGVPVIMESGKRMGAPVKDVEIILRPAGADAGEHKERNNKIVIRLEPREGIRVMFGAKKPGLDGDIEVRSLDFDFRTEEGDRGHVQYTAEYQKLILDCIAGDQTLFVSSEEIAAMWRFTDPFIAAWRKGMAPLHHYVPDSAAISAVAEVEIETKSHSHPPAKEIGIIGLGKMGAGLARHWHEKGWRVVAYNRHLERSKELAAEGIEVAGTMDELLEKFPSPRVVWLMVTAGKPVDDLLFARGGLASKLKKGDIVIDGGNSFFGDSMRRGRSLAKRGIKFLDTGVSGGPSGARNGACMMIGGDKASFEKLESLFADGSVPAGYAYFGKAGAGHFAKMVHNGIEYGMMQSLAEGFALMRKSPFKLDLREVARLYNRGSVIESRLVGWLESGYRAFGNDLKKVSGSVAATGEGEWTVRTGEKWRMKLPAIEDAFKFRVRSKKSPSYMGKILSVLRNQFGGHSIK
jgi:glucose-6-phosphate 1-dehydrogenase/6-phosphogluconate dehydrogenase (decarboxylating)